MVFFYISRYSILNMVSVNITPSEAKSVTLTQSSDNRDLQTIMAMIVPLKEGNQIIEF